MSYQGEDLKFSSHNPINTLKHSGDILAGKLSSSPANMILAWAAPNLLFQTHLLTLSYHMSNPSAT